MRKHEISYKHYKHSNTTTVCQDHSLVKPPYSIRETIADVCLAHHSGTPPRENPASQVRRKGQKAKSTLLNAYIVSSYCTEILRMIQVGTEMQLDYTNEMMHAKLIH